MAKARRNWQNRLEHYFASADELQCIKKERIAFWSPHRISWPLSPLETEEQRREEIRRIILKKKGA